MGRTLDYEFSYGEEITVMPRRYPLAFRHGGKTESHYAIIGMAHVADDYPLYYDAVNEKGLGMAGLNFVGNAVYAEPEEGKQNVAQYEFIPWLLSQCATLDEARSRLSEDESDRYAIFRTASECAAALDHRRCDRRDRSRIDGRWSPYL